MFDKLIKMLVYSIFFSSLCTAFNDFLSLGHQLHLQPLKSLFSVHILFIYVTCMHITIAKFRSMNFPGELEKPLKSFAQCCHKPYVILRKKCIVFHEYLVYTLKNKASNRMFWQR